MKSSPFRTTQGGVSNTEETTTKTKQPKKTNKGNAGKSIAEFMTPTNKLEFALSGLGGVGTGAGKWGTKFLTKTKVGQKLASKIPFVANLLKKQDVVKNQGFKAFGTKGTKGGVAGATTTKEGLEGATKNIIGGKEYYKGATHYGKVTDIKQFDGAISNATKGIGQQGKVTDKALAKMDWRVSRDLRPEHVKKIGSQSGRDIFEVAYPDGTTQKFWRSTGGGKKKVMYKGKEVSSEGFFGTVAGHMDNKLPIKQAQARASKMYEKGTKDWNDLVSALTDNKGYFIKTGGWQGYGSKTYEQTGAALKEFFDKGLIK